MLDYGVYDLTRERVLNPGVHADFSLFYVDGETSRDIVTKTLDGDLLKVNVSETLDEYAKHAHFQIDMGWSLNHPMDGEIHAALIARKSEFNVKRFMRDDQSQIEHDPSTWILGNFSTRRDLGADSATLIQMVCGFVLYSVMHQQHLIVETNGQRTVLQRSKGKPRYRTIYLSDVAKRYTRAADWQSKGPGWSMPEHEVRGHWRLLPSGKTTFVRGHKRGDPTIARKTVPVQVKL